MIVSETPNLGDGGDTKQIINFSALVLNVSAFVPLFIAYLLSFYLFEPKIDKLLKLTLLKIHYPT